MTNGRHDPNATNLFWLWLVMAIFGAVLPLSQFLPWLAEHGLDPIRFFGELFSTRIGGFFGWDVIVAACVLVLFVFFEGKRIGVPHLWLPIVATLMVGVSCGLPLFLALRERALRRND